MDPFSQGGFLFVRTGSAPSGLLSGANGDASAAANTTVTIDTAENSAGFQYLLSRYSEDSVPIAALFFVVGLFLVRMGTYALTLALQQADMNAMKADKLNHLVALLNALSAKQGKAAAGDTIPASADLDTVRQQLQLFGYQDTVNTWADLSGVTSKVKADADSVSQQGAAFQMGVQQKSSQLQNSSDFSSNGINKAWTTLQTIVSNMR